MINQFETKYFKKVSVKGIQELSVAAAVASAVVASAAVPAAATAAAAAAAAAWARPAGVGLVASFTG